MTTYGYARTSTEDQKAGLGAQIQALLGAGVEFENIFRDEYTGKTMDRPAYKQLMEKVQPGDLIVFPKLDRMGRTALGVLMEMDQLSQQGIAVKFLEPDVDTSSPFGKMVITIISGVAQLERDMISARTTAALGEIARTGIGKKGQKVERLGRPNTIQKREVLRLKRRGMMPKAIAKHLGIARSSVYNILKNPHRIERLSPHERPEKEEAEAPESAT